MSWLELNGAISLKSRAYTDPSGRRTTMKPPLSGEVEGKEGREGRRGEGRGSRGGKEKGGGGRGEEGRGGERREDKEGT